MTALKSRRKISLLDTAKQQAQVEVTNDEFARFVQKVRTASSASRTTAPLPTAVTKPYPSGGTRGLFAGKKLKAAGTPKSGVYIVVHKNEDGSISIGNQRTLHKGPFYGIGAPSIVEHRLPRSAIPTLRAALAHKVKHE